MKRFLVVSFAAVLAALVPPFVDGHFKLLAPESWIVENALGDPQKLGPCGGTSAGAKAANPGTPSNIINELHVNILVGEFDSHSWTFRSSRDFFPNAPTA